MDEKNGSSGYRSWKAILFFGCFLICFGAVVGLMQFAGYLMDHGRRYPQPKKEIVLLVDDGADKEMESYRISPDAIVAKANERFAELGFPIGYSRIAERRPVYIREEFAAIDPFHKTDDPTYDPTEADTRWNEEVDDVLRRQHLERPLPDRVVFIITDKIWAGRGFVRHFSLNGAGTIVMGVGRGPLAFALEGYALQYDPAIVRGILAPFLYLNCASSILMHEEAHLHNLRHVADHGETLMAGIIDGCDMNDHLAFDSRSAAKLRSIYR